MTEEELIEQVARALFTADGVCSDHDWQNANEVARDHFRNQARAAIAAMEPRFKAERIRGGEMVKEAAAVAYQTEAETWLQLPARGTCSRLGAKVIRALSVPAIVEAGEHQPKENSDASSD